TPVNENSEKGGALSAGRQLGPPDHSGGHGEHDHALAATALELDAGGGEASHQAAAGAAQVAVAGGRRTLARRRRRPVDRQVVGGRMDDFDSRFQYDVRASLSSKSDADAPLAGAQARAMAARIRRSAVGWDRNGE